jgi:hypothetical protein
MVVPHTGKKKELGKVINPHKTVPHRKERTKSTSNVRDMCLCSHDVLARRKDDSREEGLLR